MLVYYLNSEIQTSQEVINASFAAGPGWLGNLFEVPAKPFYVFYFIQLFGSIHNRWFVIMVPD